jgi:HK97 gp10 family phage protein
MSANWAALEASIKAAGMVALDQAAQIVAARAKEHAPVRNIFDGGSRRVRFKTRTEVVDDREIRRKLGLGREYIAAPRTRLRSRRGMGKAKVSTLDTANAPGVSELRRYVGRRNGGLEPVARAMLHRRGAYEVDNKQGGGNRPRALYKGHIGGRLRGQIVAVPAKGSKSRFVAQVISPTPYAKYMEFGTVHNAAHPYLRPALHESAPEVRKVLRAAIRGAIRGKEIRDVEEI